LPDGLLGTRFVPEMIPRSGEPVAITCQPVAPTGAVTMGNGTITLAAAESVVSAVIRGVPQDARITLRVEPAPGVRRFSLGLRGRATPEESCRLEFAPESRRAGFNRTTDSGGRRTGAWMLDGSVPLDQPFSLDVVCRHDIVDVEIGGRRTLVNRDWDPQGDRIYLVAEGGSVTFRNIVIRPLLE